MTKVNKSAQKRFAPKLHVKKGDEVMIIAGKDKGSKGIIKTVFPATNKAIIEGLNMSKKHVKPVQDQPGGIVDIEQPIHISNLMLVDKKGNATRVGRRSENGKIVRFSKKTGETI